VINHGLRLTPDERKTKKKISFFFDEAIVFGRVYLDMSEQFVYTQVADLQANIIFEQDGAPHIGV
jgi:hypothetical protein